MPLAILKVLKHTPAPNRANPDLIWGICVHTTGRGLPAGAQKKGLSPLAYAERIYCAPDPPGGFTNFPHYVIGWGGEIVQIASEKTRARHCGITAQERAQYLIGDWEHRLPPANVARWKARWPDTKSPAHLYPSKSPNEDYLGVEMIPLGQGGQGYGNTFFTADQYNALGALIKDCEARYHLQINGPRLVGHEDVEPLNRWDSRGGWDPGALRDSPYFNWALLPP